MSSGGRPTRHKYGVAKKADRTDADGIVFDSRGEMLRYHELRLMERAGLIRDLHRSVRFSITVPDLDGELRHLCDYVADFTYTEDGEMVVEDFKSPDTRTPVYKLKAKLMSIRYGITIRETARRPR